MSSNHLTEDRRSIPSRQKIRRSRNGCHRCKKLKVKCDEKKPTCSNCSKANRDCDYSLKLTWGGRPFKNPQKRTGQSSISTTTGESMMRVINMSGKSLETSSNSIEKNKNSEIDGTKEEEVKFRSDGNMRASQSIVIDFNKKAKPSVVAGDLISTPSVEESSQTSRDDTIEYPDELSKGGLGLNAALSPNSDLQSPVPNVTANSLGKKFPGLSTGIEELSNALEKMVDGGSQLIENSEILNNYLSNSAREGDQEQDYSSIYSKESDGIDMSVKKFSDGEDYDYGVDLYDQDISNIEEYLRKDQNTYKDFLLPSRFSSITKSELSQTSYSNDADNVSNEVDYIVNTKPSASSDAVAVYSSPEEILSKIPPSYTPLPELLLQVSFYRNLMHFWVHFSSDNLVPAPSHLYEENPFKVILPQMAMKYPGILTTLLAYAATSRAYLCGEEPPKKIIDQLLHRSCNELLRLLQNSEEATSDSTLASILLLACYEANHTNFTRHRAHAIGARQILNEREIALRSNPKDSDATRNRKGALILKSLRGKSNESDVTFFLIRWFAYIDVIGAMAATKKAQLYTAKIEDYETDEQTDMSTVGSDNSGGELMDPKKDIDYLMGFDVKFLPHFTKIVDLIRKTEFVDYASAGLQMSIPVDIITEALQVKDMIIVEFKRGEARRQAHLDKLIDESTEFEIKPKQKISNLIKQDIILRCTNKLFCDMAILNIYIRVLRLPRVSSLVQNIVSGMGRILKEHIESGSSSDICTIFCSFCAGCETVDPDMRNFFHQRFVKLCDLGNPNAFKGLQVMNRCWETGESWTKVSRDLDIDIALL